MYPVRAAALLLLELDPIPGFIVLDIEVVYDAPPPALVPFM
jgi:hypothetical protein